MTDYVSKAEVLDTYAELYDVFDDNSAILKEIDKVYDKINALKAQEPHVMSLEEAKSTYVIEYRSGRMCEVGSKLLDLNVDPLNAEYGKIYRVWTFRPTDEQREAVKWDG